MTTEPTGTAALHPRPPSTYVEWTVRGIDGSAVMFVTFNEADARRAHERWLAHGEPVELLTREVTTWTETRYTTYEAAPALKKRKARRVR